jgi:hypothetical protein
MRIIMVHGDGNEQKEEDGTRDLLPFWARELLAMRDEAEKKPNVRKLECVK